MTLQQALEAFINTLNFDGSPAPTCPTVHPHVRSAVMNLERSPDFQEMWARRLSPLQQVERHCLATELRTSLQTYLPAQEYRSIEKELLHLLLYAITMAWLVHEQVALEIGDESGE